MLICVPWYVVLFKYLTISSAFLFSRLQCNGPKCHWGYSSSSSSSSSSDSSSSSEDCQDERKECKKDCRSDYGRRLDEEAAEMPDEQRRLGKNRLKNCYKDCKKSFRDCQRD